MSSNLGMIEKWTNRGGGKCFRFQERKYFERPWIIAILAILLISGTVTEYFVNGSLNSMGPNFIVLFFVFFWWLSIPMRANESVIEKTVHELVDELVAIDAHNAGTSVVKSCVHYDTKGTYAIITGRCFLVLMKNGQVWEYPIIYHNSSEEEEGYYECKRVYAVSENPKHIRSIKPRGVRNIVDKLEVPDEVKLWLLILAIVSVGGVAFWGVYWLVLNIKWWKLLLVVFLYVVVFGIIERLIGTRTGKTIEFVKWIVSAPIVIVYFLFGLIQPFLATLGTYFFVAFYAFGIPTLILKGVSKVGCFELKPETIAFLVIALGSALCSTYAATKRMIRLSPLKNWGNHEYEFNREQLALYLVHPRNMVFLGYLIYFLYLSVSGFLIIQNESYLISETYDAAVLKAFLVYIAYTNMLNKAKETIIKPKELLQMISGLFVQDR